MAKKKPKEKYPYLYGCYVDIDGGYSKTFSRQYLGATVELDHYKGAMLLRVTPERPKKKDKHVCRCPSIRYPSAWLKGDDLDAMIALLRDAKREWVKAYDTAKRYLAKQEKNKKREASLLTARKRFRASKRR